MSSLWIINVHSQDARLRQLAPSDLRLFAVACADHAAAVSYARFVGSLPSQKLDLVRLCLDKLWDSLGRDVSGWEPVVQQLRAIMPDEDSPDVLIPGWAFILEAILSAIKCVRFDASLKAAIDASASSYSSVAQVEHVQAMRSTGKGLVGDDIVTVEETSQRCREEVAFQLDCLRKIESRQAVSRSLIS